MIGAIVLSPTDAATHEPVVGSAQRVVVARARAPRDAAVQHCCLEYLGFKHPDSELEGSARSAVQFEDVLPEAAPWVAYAPVDVDGQVGVVVDVSPEVYYTTLATCCIIFSTCLYFTLSTVVVVPASRMTSKGQLTYICADRVFFLALPVSSGEVIMNDLN